MPVWFWTLCK